MRFQFLFALIALLGSAAVDAKQSKNIGKIKPGVEAPIDPVAARKSIEAANQNFVVALKKHDAKTIADAFEPDVIFLPPGMDALHGRDEVSKFFAAFMAASTIDETGSITLDVSVAANTAYETGLYTMTTRSGNAAPVADHGKYLCVWKHDADGHWRIAREIFNTSIAPAKSPPH
ncbi:MAG: SgcJ/EcaC family oxidoreductase [Rudaea sp.]